MNASVYPTASDPIRHWALLAGARTALVDRPLGCVFTYRELDALIDRYVLLLDAARVRAADIVATLAGNRHEQVALFYACARLGAALAPLNWRLPPAELTPILRNAQPRAIFGVARHQQTAQTALAAAALDVPWHDLDTDVPALLRRCAGRTPPEPRAAAAEDPALVLYTSGTTGTPKGAVLPRRQILFNALATNMSWELGPSDVAPVSTPLFHTGGWNVFATPLWQCGGTVVLFDGFDADDFLRGLAEHACTVALTVPTQLVMLAEASTWGTPLPALRSFFSGGAPLPAQLATRVRAAGYALREGYGLTECGPNCFAMPAALAPERPGVVGWPVQFLDARVVDERGREVADGSPGELWLRGPQRFTGYLRDARTGDALTADGWLRTSDLARREPDGAFAICGRKKDMFISGGENVYPAEVEAALIECGAVLECAVIGVADDRWGEVGCAFVVRRTDTTLDTDDILRYARTRLAGYKVPRVITFLDALPRLGSGKVDRSALARMMEVPHG